MTADGINDASDYQETVNAMEAMGIGDKQEQIWNIVAAILHLGDVIHSEQSPSVRFLSLFVRNCNFRFFDFRAVSCLGW